MKQPNWDDVAHNIREARCELQQLEALIADTKKRSEGGFKFSLRHAYHHLNFAWNIRYIKPAKYMNLTDSDFKRWGKFPAGFDY